MKGIEIGGAAHNPFNLDTINVDVSNDNPIYMVEQRAYGNDALPVDVIANGDNLPFDDKSFDFVISSHVLEHFINPIKALIEWGEGCPEIHFHDHPPCRKDRGGA